MTAAVEKKKILIIDDNEDLVDVLCEQLTHMGYDVEGATSAEEGITALTAKRPHLILLDIMMPHVDGYSFLKKIRSDTSFNDVIIVILSAKGDNLDITKAFNLGADDYLIKPFSGEILAEMMEALLE